MHVVVFCSKNCERPANTRMNDGSCCQQCGNTNRKTVEHTAQCDNLYNEYLLAQFAQTSKNTFIEKWACSVCTFQNDSYRTKCQICDKPKRQNKQSSNIDIDIMTSPTKQQKSPKRKRGNIDNLSLDSNFMSEPLNKKQKIFSIENANKNQYDTDDQKEDEQHMRNIDESDSDIEILNNAKGKECQIINVFVDPASVNLLLAAASDDMDIESSKQVSNRLDTLSQQFCSSNTDITHNLNINVETPTLKQKPKPKCNSKPTPLLFNSPSQRKQNGFDLNNKHHLKIAREQVIKKRIQRLKSKDSKHFNLDLNEFISVHFIMNKIKENENLHDGDILCDICKNKMYILSEKHQFNPALTMNISRFNHSIYHKRENIKTLECGMCNFLRGKDSIGTFMEKIDKILAEPNSKESSRHLRICRHRINAPLLELDLWGVSSNATQNVISCKELIQHFKTIQNADKTLLFQLCDSVL